MMTRRDYVLIAGALREAAVEIDTHDRAMMLMSERHLTPETVLAVVVKTLSRHLCRDNPRFDFDRFRRAALPEVTR